VVRAPKDGYRLLLGSATILAANRFLYRRSMGFDPLTDLAPVTRVATGTVVLVVRADRSWKSFAELLAAAKAAPGKITMGSCGTGTVSHLTLAALEKATGVDITHVPYRGGALAIRDLLVGNVDMMFDVAPAILPHLRSGEFRALAVGSAKRVAGVPELRDVPSMEELLPGSGIDAQAWYAVLTTAGTPQDRIDRLFAAFAGLVRSEAFRDRMVPEGLTPVWDDSPAAFAAYLQTQTEYWRRLVEASGATLD
jgi:tripartite-type tricarboxylate transporter receptor subunit TctC